MILLGRFGRLQATNSCRVSPRALRIEGVGTVHWSFIGDNGDQVTLITPALYVPAAKARILSPQRLFQTDNTKDGKFVVRGKLSHLDMPNAPSILIAHDGDNHLPIMDAVRPSAAEPMVNMCVTADANENLTAAQKHLLRWHYRFGHRSLRNIQHVVGNKPFTNKLDEKAARL